MLRVLCIIFTFFCSFNTNVYSRVYVLHGACSSGKTTLAQKLAEKVPHAKIVQIDDFVWDYFFQAAQEDGFEGKTKQDLEAWMKSNWEEGKRQQVYDDFVQNREFCIPKIAEQAKQHENVILDIFFESESNFAREFCKTFSKYDTQFILVHAELKVLAARTKARNLDKDKESRSLDWVLNHYMSLYEPMQGYRAGALSMLQSGVVDNVLAIRDKKYFPFLKTSQEIEKEMGNVGRKFCKKFGKGDCLYRSVLAYDHIVRSDTQSIKGMVETTCKCKRSSAIRKNWEFLQFRVS